MHDKACAPRHALSVLTAFGSLPISSSETFPVQGTLRRHAHDDSVAACRCCSGRSGHGPRSATLSAPAVTCTPLCLLAMFAIPDMQLRQPKAVHSTVSPLATVAVLQQCVPPPLPPLATGAVMKLVASRPLVAAAASITKVRYAFCVSHEGTWQ